MDFSFSLQKNTEDKEIDINRIKVMIQCVLDHKFSNIHKRKIEEFNNRLNFACIYCGDSATDDFKKRASLYIKNLHIKCYNCSAYVSLYNFLKEFQPYCKIDDDDLYIFKRYQNSLNSIFLKNKELNIFNFNKIEKLAFQKDTLKETFGFIDVKDTKAEKFLNNRYHFMYDNFLYDRKNDSLIILNGNNKIILGYQSRPLKQKKYFTYKLSKIYEDAELVCTEEISNLNNISTIFNILNINFNDIITVFEGPMDAFLFGNSIALAGAHNILDFNVENMRFWFDNDITGYSKASSKLKEGYNVFLWKKYLKDLKIFEKIKDLNDLIIYTKRNSIQLIPFENYFSNNKLDLFYV